MLHPVLSDSLRDRKARSLQECGLGGARPEPDGQRWIDEAGDGI